MNLDKCFYFMILNSPYSIMSRGMFLLEHADSAAVISSGQRFWNDKLRGYTEAFTNELQKAFLSLIQIIAFWSKLSYTLGGWQLLHILEQNSKFLVSWWTLITVSLWGLLKINDNQVTSFSSKYSWEIPLPTSEEVLWRLRSMH